MNYELLYVHWNPDLVMFHLGPVAIRWYSTCWLIGLLLSYLTVKYLYRKQKIDDEKFEPLFIYCFIGILIGARLGHCLFYEPGYFLSSGAHIAEMLLPVRQDMWGDWHFTGYEGLASHGGSIGVIIAGLLYCYRMKMKPLIVCDTVSIAVPFTATFIRLGNLMNSEIIGKPTDLPWAFIFERVDMQPRHPGQLYEAIAYLCIGILLIMLWKKRPDYVGTGFFLGTLLFCTFIFRFFIEYTKEVQEAFEATLPVDMGQILSIPFILIGAYFMVRGMRKIKS